MSFVCCVTLNLPLCTFPSLGCYWCFCTSEDTTRTNCFYCRRVFKQIDTLDSMLQYRITLVRWKITQIMWEDPCPILRKFSILITIFSTNVSIKVFRAYTAQYHCESNITNYSLQPRPASNNCKIFLASFNLSSCGCWTHQNWVSEIGQKATVAEDMHECFY